uniref:Uncharacterized protein n=1 Tax=Glossina austeni TaxID=7395 RepID=A0A1A9V7S1_GLOAU
MGAFSGPGTSRPQGRQRHQTPNHDPHLAKMVPIAIRATSHANPMGKQAASGQKIMPMPHPMARAYTSKKIESAQPSSSRIDASRPRWSPQQIQPQQNITTVTSERSAYHATNTEGSHNCKFATAAAMIQQENQQQPQLSPPQQVPCNNNLDYTNPLTGSSNSSATDASIHGNSHQMPTASGNYVLSLTRNRQQQQEAQRKKNRQRQLRQNKKKNKASTIAAGQAAAVAKEQQQRQNHGNKSPTAEGLPTKRAPIVAKVDTTRIFLANGPAAQRRKARGTRALKGANHPALPRQQALRYHNEMTPPCSAQATGPATVLRRHAALHQFGLASLPAH